MNNRKGKIQPITYHQGPERE